MTRAVMSFLPLLALLVAAFAAPAHAAADKGAENAYHTAAALYVEGKLQDASVEAEEGLRRYPDDTRLRMLVEQLRKMKDEQRGGGKGDGKKDDKKNDGKRDGNGNKDGGKKDDKNDKGDGNDDGKNDKSRDDDRNGKDGNTPPAGDRARDEAPARQPSMSEAEAKRLLNSFADDEKKEQAERRKVLRARPGTEQDW